MTLNSNVGLIETDSLVWGVYKRAKIDHKTRYGKINH